MLNILLQEKDYVNKKRTEIKLKNFLHKTNLSKNSIVQLTQKWAKINSNNFPRFKQPQITINK